MGRWPTLTAAPSLKLKPSFSSFLSLLSSSQSFQRLGKGQRSECLIYNLNLNNSNNYSDYKQIIININIRRSKRSSCKIVVLLPSSCLNTCLINHHINKTNKQVDRITNIRRNINKINVEDKQEEKTISSQPS